MKASVINRSIVGICKEISDRLSALWHIKKALSGSRKESVGSYIDLYKRGHKLQNDIERLRIIKAELYLILFMSEHLKGRRNLF